MPGMKRPEPPEVPASASMEASDPSLEDWQPETDHDDSLIRWMLDLTPAKRLAALQDFADGVTALQRNARKITQ
jgi:hypothetical protein